MTDDTNDDAARDDALEDLLEACEKERDAALAELDRLTTRRAELVNLIGEQAVELQFLRRRLREFESAEFKRGNH